MTHPGPQALGRSVVVRPGAEAPAAWADAPRVVVDQDALDAPVAVVEALHAAWSARHPVVVDLSVNPDELRAPERYLGPVHELTPRFTLWRERLQFLVWANSYDARDGDPVWWHGRKFARMLADRGVDEVGPADVTAADGTVLWVDGGPPDPPDPGDGIGVVHRWTAEAGRLTVSTRRAPEADLAPDQLCAVDHPSGPARVIAAAGSGKTRTLIYRVAFLLEQGIPAQYILLLTFTNKAAKEMMRRAADLLGGELTSLWGGTFHSIGARVLRRHARLLEPEPQLTRADREAVARAANVGVAPLALHGGAH